MQSITTANSGKFEFWDALRSCRNARNLKTRLLSWGKFHSCCYKSAQLLNWREVVTRTTLRSSRWWFDAFRSTLPKNLHPKKTEESALSSNKIMECFVEDKIFDRNRRFICNEPVTYHSSVFDEYSLRKAIQMKKRISQNHCLNDTFLDTCCFIEQCWCFHSIFTDSKHKNFSRFFFKGKC